MARCVSRRRKRVGAHTLLRSCCSDAVHAIAFVSRKSAWPRAPRDGILPPPSLPLMARIPDSVVEQVRSTVDLVDVVSDYVRLKKQGSRFVGLCPFHNEKTPSFSVDPRQDLFYCFGCKAGGDLFKFVEQVEGVGFLDAVRLLAERAGIEIVEEEGSREAASEREAMLAA